MKQHHGVVASGLMTMVRTLEHINPRRVQHNLDLMPAVSMHPLHYRVCPLYHALAVGDLRLTAHLS